MRFDRFAAAFVVCALGSTPSVRAADEERKSQEKRSPKAGMSRSPAPVSGSMPKGPAPRGKLGTEPMARGKLGTDPKPDESSKPPRPN